MLAWDAGGADALPWLE